MVGSQTAAGVKIPDQCPGHRGNKITGYPPPNPDRSDGVTEKNQKWAGIFSCSLFGPQKQMDPIMKGSGVRHSA